MGPVGMTRGNRHRRRLEKTWCWNFCEIFWDKVGVAQPKDLIKCLYSKPDRSLSSQSYLGTQRGHGCRGVSVVLTRGKSFLSNQLTLIFKGQGLKRVACDFTYSKISWLLPLKLIFKAKKVVKKETIQRGLRYFMKWVTKATVSVKNVNRMNTI